jgi:hypothetical protein
LRNGDRAISECRTILPVLGKQQVEPRGGLILQVDLSEIDDELIKYLAQHPEGMHDMAPRKFEELVAAIFRAKGYTVELTPERPVTEDSTCAHSIGMT